MDRSYELGLVIEPRQSDDEVKGIVERYREMITERGGTVTEIEDWGKRKLAYPIRKFSEGKYVFFFVSAKGAVSWEEIETNLQQNESVLRHLVVRTDLDLKRAATKGARRKPTDGDKPAGDKPDGEKLDGESNDVEETVESTEGES